MATLQKLGEHTYAVGGGSVIGFICVAGNAVMVDAGLDRDSAKRALRAFEETGARVAALVITHGHADHFGGAAWAASQTGCTIHAAGLEAVFAQHPVLEPPFLYGGAAPPAELRGKFTLAREGIQSFEALPSDRLNAAGLTMEIIALPGHAPGQVGVGYEETLFCGDVVFPQETLDKHPILFCADLDAWLSSLARLPSLDYAWFVPGHGAPLREIAPAAEATAGRLREIRVRVWEALAEPRSAQAILQAVAMSYGASLDTVPAIVLALTTIHSALTSLQGAGEVETLVEGSALLWRRK